MTPSEEKELKECAKEAFREIDKPDTYCGTPRLANLQDIMNYQTKMYKSSDEHGSMENFLRVIREAATEEENRSQDYIPEKGDPQWVAIEHMGEHPHGLYLCLLKNSDKASEPFHVEERYFTYNSEHRSTFESAEKARGVVAFMVPRFYPSFGKSRERDLQRTIDVLRRQLKDVTEAKELADEGLTVAHMLGFEKGKEVTSE